MKKSVNGKSFDEIFGQRGEEVKPNQMIYGEYYLLVHTLCSPTHSIAIFKKLGGIDNKPDKMMAANIECMIFQNTQSIFFSGSTTFSLAFEATPDQIELLNAYKNESK